MTSWKFIFYLILPIIKGFSILHNACTGNEKNCFRDGVGHHTNEINRLFAVNVHVPSPNSKTKSFKKWKNEDFCGKSKVVQSSRIVGGKTAIHGQFPWQVQIWAEKFLNSAPEFTCGGSLITEEIILTAAHCIQYTSPERYSVILGRQYVEDKDESCPGYEQRLQVTKLLIHPDFNKRHLSNDIAILWIKSNYNQTVRYTDYIVPACMPDVELNDRDYYNVGSLGTVTGWGLLNETDDKGSNSLQYVSVPILDHDKCYDAYGRFVDLNQKGQFCAGNDKGQDACAGDSGGPYVLTKDDRYYLIGVVSYGRGCARAEYPGVYTKVQHYMPWIQEMIGENSEQDDISPITTTISTTTITTTTTTISTTTTTKRPLKTTSVFCSNQYSLLRCQSPQTITVVEVVYAQDVEGYCGGSRKRNRAAAAVCSLENAEVVPKHMCDGKRACWLYHNLFHRDPCPSEIKYSIVHYSCDN